MSWKALQDNPPPPPLLHAYQYVNDILCLNVCVITLLGSDVRCWKLRPMFVGFFFSTVLFCIPSWFALACFAL